MSFHFIGRTPETALDDLIAEQAMDNHIPSRPTPSYWDDLLPRASRPKRRCRACGGIGGHTSVMCPGYDGE